MATKTSTSTAQPLRTFYLPGTAITSPSPGRVQRFVTSHLADRGVATRVTAAHGRVREFYLPATFHR